MTARRLIIFLLFTVVMTVWQTDLFGQPGSPTKPNENGVPITGLEYLLGGGILYGIRTLLKARKKQSD